MRDDTRQLLLEAFYSLLLAGAVLAVVALIFPGAPTRHPWLAGGASMAWGIAASAGLRFWHRRKEGAVETSGGSWEEFARALTLIVGCDELLHNGIGRIRSLSHAEGVAILVADAPGEAYTLRASLGYPAADLPGMMLQDNARLVKWLYTNEIYLVSGESPEVVGSLPPEERGLLERLGAKVVFPLVASNRLIGVILASAREDLSRDRVEGAWGLVPQLALALENALLYEQQRLRVRRFYRAERLATTGQLAAGAAHEIRNPLASIRSTIQYLRRDLEDNPESADMVAELMAEIDRINAIVEGMLALARPADPVFEEVDLVEVLLQTVRLIEPTARKSRVEIETYFPSAATRHRADPNQLKQVVLNVMMNAVQAMPDGGKLIASVSRLGRAPGGPQWKVEIADTGAGIPEEHQERIFDPFFTTKRDGTGLGLSICHAILEAHGGQIEVDSTAGQGTRVEIRL